MARVKKQPPATELPSPMTGNRGIEYEFEVIAYFLLLMVLDAIPPVVCPGTKIRKLVPQNKKDLDEEQDRENPFETDDLIVYCSNDERDCKILISIKTDIKFTEKDTTTRKVIQAAYRDTQKKTFSKEHDRVVLATQVLDGYKNGILGIINRAKTAKTYALAFPESSLTKSEEHALRVIENTLKLEKEEIYSFVKCFDVLIIDIRSPLDQDGYSVSLSTMLSLVEKSKRNNDTLSIDVWSKTFEFAAKLDNISGIIEKGKLPDVISDYYCMALGIDSKKNKTAQINNYEYTEMPMLLLGCIDSDSEGDLELFSNLRNTINE